MMVVITLEGVPKNGRVSFSEWPCGQNTPITVGAQQNQIPFTFFFNPYKSIRYFPRLFIHVKIGIFVATIPKRDYA